MLLRGLLFVAVFSLVPSQSNGDVIFQNLITGTNPNAFNPYTTGQTFDSGITVSGIGRGGGINGTDTNDRYNATSWNTSVIDLTAYFTFTLTPNTGNMISYESFQYQGQASATGPTTFAFRSSLDGFSANVGSANANGTTINLSSAQFQNVNSATEFRLYGWGATSSAGTFSVNEFTFTGTVSAVPEPSSIALLSLVGFGGVVLRRFRCGCVGRLN
ncbi:MAG: PEP-CTERM sorting domain-containing protein [Pirellula sp.]|jgi:hypothetical protein|nr:PEP-CTERM sorting domain-containing protein [Pirellula sp.]